MDMMKARVIYYVYMMKARVDILCVYDEGQNGYDEGQSGYITCI